LLQTKLLKQQGVFEFCHELSYSNIERYVILPGVYVSVLHSCGFGFSYNGCQFS